MFNQNKNENNMKIVVNNKAKNKAKKIMDLLMNCINDPKLSTKERNKYYSEYLKVSANYLILSK